MEEPLGEDEEEDVEMDYVEEEYDSEESHDSEEAEAMEVAAADDVDIHDGEETDPEDDEEMLGGENEEDEEEEVSDDEDEESVSDNQDGAQGNMGEDMWQVCEDFIYFHHSLTLRRSSTCLEMKAVCC